jgi:hypothetical protein
MLIISNYCFDGIEPFNPTILAHLGICFSASIARLHPWWSWPAFGQALSLFHLAFGWAAQFSGSSALPSLQTCSPEISFIPFNSIKLIYISAFQFPFGTWPLRLSSPAPVASFSTYSVTFGFPQRVIASCEVTFLFQIPAFAIQETACDASAAPKIIWWASLHPTPFASKWAIEQLFPAALSAALRFLLSCFRAPIIAVGIVVLPIARAESTSLSFISHALSFASRARLWPERPWSWGPI